MSKINPNFATELQKYGAFDFSACFNCGTCTATCSLTDEDNAFPRSMVRAGVLGLENKIQSSVDPWLCYYCGECSTACPRQADPGELMMAMRRYLTASYDWTGLARKFYTSKIWELAAIAFFSSIVLLLFVFFHGPMTTELTAEGGVKLNTFAPWKTVEIGDWIMAAVLVFFLVSNIFNMWLKIIFKRKSLKIPIKLYFIEIKNLVLHFATQKRLNDCDDDTRGQKKPEKTKTYWYVHLLLMTSYVMIFTMIVVFLGWFQTENIYAWYHPQRILGYYTTFGLLVGTVYFMYLRYKKTTIKSRKTHYTDWTFLVLLFLTTFTGILVHIFRIYGMPMTTYYTYVIHLMILFPMLMIEVPFSKWSHLAYRPFAIYFNNIVISAMKIQKKKK
jgi:ferredoxin